jgi:hypothetical protein
MRAALEEARPGGVIDVRPDVVVQRDSILGDPEGSDPGSSWDRRPTVVDQIHVANVCFAFDCSTSATRVRTGDILPEFAVDRTTGYYYATWQDAHWTRHA